MLYRRSFRHSTRSQAVYENQRDPANRTAEDLAKLHNFSLGELEVAYAILDALNHLPSEALSSVTERMHNAFRGPGTDETVIFDIAARLDEERWEHLVRMYPENYGERLYEVIKRELTQPERQHLRNILDIAQRKDRRVIKESKWGEEIEERIRARTG